MYLWYLKYTMSLFCAFVVPLTHSINQFIQSLLTTFNKKKYGQFFYFPRRLPGRPFNDDSQKGDGFVLVVLSSQ